MTVGEGLREGIFLACVFPGMTVYHWPLRSVVCSSLGKPTSPAPCFSQLSVVLCGVGLGLRGLFPIQFGMPVGVVM